MKYIKDLHEGEKVRGIYLCKQKTSAITKNGKPYENVILQDKTGTVDCKIWDVNSYGIDDFDALDYVDIVGDVSVFNGALQISISNAKKCHEGEYDPRDYLPVSERDIDEMYKELLGLIGSVKNIYLRSLLEEFFVKDQDFIKKFRDSSAAKSVHHNFIGGLLEHTVSVAWLCDKFAMHYPMLKRDLLVTAALLHDVGKVKEFSSFPENDYTDEGNLLGHIVMGSEMVSEKAKYVPDFPAKLENELKHCILAHHGKLEYGSPKKPAIIEAVALNFADDLDAKMETFKEILNSTNETGWLGFNRLFETNLRATNDIE